MDDAAYLFKQRSVEAKRLARGAYAKKGGSRSRKCSLPSDKLSKKELKERNGTVFNYKLREPMNWAAFKKMPDDLQREYIQFLVIEKKARLKDVAEMFGTDPENLSNFLAHREWGKGLFKSRYKSPSPEWLAFIGNADSEPSDSPELETIPEPVLKQQIEDTLRSEVKLDDNDAAVIRGELTYDGYAAAALERAYEAMDKNVKYRITVSFWQVEDFVKED